MSLYFMRNMKILFMLVVLVSCLGQACCDHNNNDAPSSSSSSSEDLKKVIKSAVSGLIKLRDMVKEYEGQLSDTRTRALLTDCVDLTSDSKDVVRESMSLLAKLNMSSDSSGNNGGGDMDDNAELLRTNLSAALTDITTCTDGLHDELTDDSKDTKVAVNHIDKQAAKVSLLLSRALSLATSIHS